jgi:hypothetical protein
MSQGTDEENKNLGSCDPISENGQGWIKLNGPCCGGGEHACMNLNRNCGTFCAKIEQGGLGIKPCRLRSGNIQVSKQELQS